MGGNVKAIPEGFHSLTPHLVVRDAVAQHLMDAFWGDRYGKVVDPFGHQWSLATHTQDLSEEEIRKAGEAAFAQMAEQG